MRQITAPSVKIFDYVDDLDCFVVSDQRREIADTLELTEWRPAVWIGRWLVLDNDFEKNFNIGGE